jgi:hypothetical protein
MSKAERLGYLRVYLCGAEESALAQEVSCDDLGLTSSED